MTASDLHSALLRPAVLQVLKAMGFSLAKPVVVDTLTDLTARYLLLLASETGQLALNNHGDSQPTVQDVRLALEKVGALRPQMKATEEAARGYEKVDGILVPFEDLRGVRNLVKWAEGPIHKEIRRVGGLDGGEKDNVADLAADMAENEDYVTGKFGLEVSLYLHLLTWRSNQEKTQQECGGVTIPRHNARQR